MNQNRLEGAYEAHLQVCTRGAAAKVFKTVIGPVMCSSHVSLSCDHVGVIKKKYTYNKRKRLSLNCDIILLFCYDGYDNWAD